MVFICVIYCISDIIVTCAQYINQWCFDNWQLFSNQNYFDPSGLFITVLLSLPLCIISLIALILALYNASRLVIKVKTFEFKQQLRAKKKLQNQQKKSQENSKSAAKDTKKNQ